MPVVRRQTFKIATVVLGGQYPLSLDYLKIPFQASVLVDLVSGTATYDVEFTTDDLVNMSGISDPMNFRWIPLPTMPPGQTETKQATIDFPVTGVRLNIQSMTGELRFSVIQGIGIS